MSKKIIDRYIWLIETVAKAGEDGISFKDINKRWCRTELSGKESYPLRTFHNHRNEISDIFNIDIVCNPVFNTYYVDVKKLRRIRSKSNKLLLSFLAGLVGDDGFCADEFDEPKEDVKTQNIVEPETVEPKIIEPKIVEPKEEKLPEIAKESYPAEWDNNPIEIQIQVYEQIKEIIKLEPIHPSQRELSKTAKSLIISLMIEPTESFKQLVMSYGEQMEIISPNSLRKEITDMFGSAVKRYTETKPAKKKKDEKNDGIIELW